MFGLHMVVLIACIHISQEIVAIFMFPALKPLSKHDRKHVLQLVYFPFLKSGFRNIL